MKGILLARLSERQMTCHFVAVMMKYYYLNSYLVIYQQTYNYSDLDSMKRERNVSWKIPPPYVSLHTARITPI